MIHEQVRGHLLELEVGTPDVELGALAHRLQHPLDEAAFAEGAIRLHAGHHFLGELGQRHQPRARALVQALDEREHLVLQHAGTSHSQRSSLTWFSA